MPRNNMWTGNSWHTRTAPHVLQCTSTLETSLAWPTDAAEYGAQNDGHPVLESNFASPPKSGAPQHAHT